MAITKVDSGTAGFANSVGSPSITFNITPAENDVVVLVIAFDDSGPTITGYAEAGYAFPYVKIYHKRMSSSPDATLAMTGNIATLSTAWYILRGVNTTTVEDAAAVTGTFSSAVPNTGSITTATNGAWVISCAGQFFASNATAAPSGYSSFLAFDQGTPNVMAAWKEVASAGAEDPGAFTADAVNGGGITWAVRPAAVPATGAPNMLLLGVG